MSRNVSDANYLSDTVLGTRDTAVNKVVKYPFFMEKCLPLLKKWLILETLLKILYPLSTYVYWEVPQLFILPYNSPTSAGYPTIQLNSDTIYLNIESDIKKKSHSYKIAPSLILDTNHKSRL